jgi:hypothetical protein
LENVERIVLRYFAFQGDSPMPVSESERAEIEDQVRDQQRREFAQWGRIGGHTRWSQTQNRTAATEPARQGLLKKFER